jgi:predicted anti-sigma-YlaC factor YlaD
MPSATLDAHLAKCVECAAWVATASQASRAVRVSSADIPDLSSQIMHSAVLPVRGLLRLRRILQVGLVVTALAQILLAVPELFGHSIGMSMSGHMSHESASFNIAIGIGLLAVVLRPVRASGMLPVMTAIVVSLVTLSIPDVLRGTVELARLATHMTTIIGLALLFAMSRLASDDPLGGLSDALPSNESHQLGQPRDHDGGSGIRGVA